jgi:hypothetical protein
MNESTRTTIALACLAIWLILVFGWPWIIPDDWPLYAKILVGLLLILTIPSIDDIKELGMDLCRWLKKQRNSN